MITIAQPRADNNSDQMIAVGPYLGFNLDCSIPPPFKVRVGDAAERNRTIVDVLKLGNPNQIPEAINTALMVPMPDSMNGFVQADGADFHARVEIYSQAGVLFQSFEMEKPRQVNPSLWTCQNGGWFNVNEPYSRCFLTCASSGSGLSFAKYTLRGTDLDSEIPHPLIFTLPPRFFGLVDTVNHINDQYCCGYATMPLGASVKEGGQQGLSAWGTGATIYLKNMDITKYSLQAQRVLRCLMLQGAMLNDRDAASRSPEVVAISAENTVPISVAKELHNAVTLGQFYVGKMTARYNWRTKVYPVF